MPSHHAGPTSAQVGSEKPIAWAVESETRLTRLSSGELAEQPALSVLTLQATPSPASPAARHQQHPLACSIVEEVVSPPPPAHQKFDGLPPFPPQISSVWDLLLRLVLALKLGLVRACLWSIALPALSMGETGRILPQTIPRPFLRLWPDPN